MLKHPESQSIINYLVRHFEACVEDDDGYVVIQNDASLTTCVYLNDPDLIRVTKIRLPEGNIDLLKLCQTELDERGRELIRRLHREIERIPAERDYLLHDLRGAMEDLDMKIIRQDLELACEVIDHLQRAIDHINRLTLTEEEQPC